jgi:hypothetical protein
VAQWLPLRGWSPLLPSITLLFLLHLCKRRFSKSNRMRGRDQCIACCGPSSLRKDYVRRAGSHAAAFGRIERLSPSNHLTKPR